MPVAEFCEFTPSKAYTDDNSIIDPAIKAVAKHAGVMSAWAGFHYEDTAVGYAIVVWDTLENHQTLQADKASYSEILALLAPVYKPDSFSMLHFNLDGDPNDPRAFLAPLADFTFLELKKRVPRENYEKAVVELQKKAFFFHGECVEKPGYFVAFSGYDSVEAHMAVAEQPGFYETAEAVERLIKRDMNYAKLRKIA